MSLPVIAGLSLFALFEKLGRSAGAAITPPAPRSSPPGSALALWSLLRA